MNVYPSNSKLRLTSVLSWELVYSIHYTIIALTLCNTLFYCFKMVEGNVSFSKMDLWSLGQIFYLFLEVNDIKQKDTKFIIILFYVNYVYTFYELLILVNDFDSLIYIIFMHLYE